MKERRWQTDVLIIGGGIAGAFAAIKAWEAGVSRVTLVSKGKLGKDGASTFGSGVYRTVPPEADREAAFRQRALRWFSELGLGDQELLEVLVNEGYERLMEMEKWGVKLRKTPDGKVETMRGMMQGVFPIPGPQVMEAMAKKVMEIGTDVVGFTMIVDLLTEAGKSGKPVVGAVGFDVRTGEFQIFEARSIILASGGCAFKGRWIGHRNLTGDGLAMAYRAGAELGGLEMANLIVSGADYDFGGRAPLTGLEAHWLNVNGERYMFDYDPQTHDKALTQVHTAATAMEVKGGKGPIYLDMTHFTSDDMKYFNELYPLTVKGFEREGVVVQGKVVKKIEVQPCFVGTFNNGGGGIRVKNVKCETSLPGLYACGDAMMRGPSFLIPGAAVTGARAGSQAALYAKGRAGAGLDKEQVAKARSSTFASLERKDGIDPDHVILGVQEAIFPQGVSIIARADRLEKAIKEVEGIRDEEVPLLYASDPHYLRLAHEAKNMVLVAEMYLKSRLLREESRTHCLREDYPYVDNISWLKWTCLKDESGTMKLWTEDIPIEKYRILPERKRYLHPMFEVAQKRGIGWGEP